MTTDKKFVLSIYRSAYRVKYYDSGHQIVRILNEHEYWSSNNYNAGRFEQPITKYTYESPILARQAAAEQIRKDMLRKLEQ